MRRKKKARTEYSYLHLPKLPTELVMQILLYVEEEFENVSRNTGNVIETNSTGLELHNKRLLPQVVLDPSILRPHYVNAIRSNWTLKTISKKPLKLSVLTDKRISKILKLNVKAKIRELVREDIDVLHILTEQLPQRWNGLFLEVCESASKNVVPFLRSCESCYPSMTFLTVDGECTIEHIFSFPALPTTKAVTASSAPPSLLAGISIDVLPLLHQVGALSRVTNLELLVRNREIWKNIILSVTLLPEILSNMPHLHFMSLDGLWTDKRFSLRDLPKVRSEALHTIQILDGEGEDVFTFLALFSNCPIRFLDVEGDIPCLEGLSEHFPRLKKLTYVSDNLHFLVVR